MKLKVYQQGGGLIYTPFIPGAQGTTSRSGSGEDDSKIDPLDKEILALMKDQNLLPSDIQAIYSSLTAFQKKTQHLSGLGGTSAYRSVMPGMLKIMNMVSVARANKEQWDNSVSEIKKHDAGSEVALDGYGRMWVRNKENGELSRVTPDEFDREKYIPVSNSQLLSYRQRDNNLAFSDNMFGETGMDVVGMKDIRSELDTMISNIGEIETSNFQLQKFSDIAQDIQGMGVYKVTQKYSKGDIADFANLLYSRLSNGAKHLIDAHAAIDGYDKHDYILSIIRMQTDSSVIPSYDSSLSKATGMGTGEGNEKLDTKDTYAEHLNNGNMFGGGSWMIIQPSNSDLALYAYAQDVGAVLKDEKRFETANLAEVLTNADAIGAIVDAGNIYFGDQLLNGNDFSKVMYDSSSNMKRVYLPVKPDPDHLGHYQPDFDTQQKVGKLQEYMDSHGEISYAYIKEKLEDIPNAYLDEEHKVIRFKNERPFLAINGIVSSEKVRFNTASNYIRSMDRGEGDPRKDYKDTYNHVINYGYETGNDKNRYDNGKASGRSLYEGVIYMPLTSPTVAAGIFNTEHFNKSVYTDAGQKSDTRQASQTAKTNFVE